MGVTAPSTAAEKQGRSEPVAGGAARGPRVPVRKSGKNKKKRRGWYKIVRQSRPVRVVGRRLPRRAKRLLKAARKWQRERADWLRFRWRRSLQLRVVTTTLALSALVIAVLGFFLTQQISDGLLLNKEKSATAQLSQGLTVAESNANLNKVPTFDRDREQLPVPDRAGTAGRQRRQQQLHRDHRGQPAAGPFGLHRRRGRRS